MQSELRDEKAHMTRSWSLRQLFPMMWNGAPEQGAVKEKVFATGVIRFGDFTIDIDERIVTLCGEELPLTSEEFDVLVFLTDHPQRLVTPRTMLATPGMANGVRKTEFLRALISLRKKLDAAGPGQHYLRTEPWIIYRFNPASSSTA
jgi:DNA-binding response OmpR family regulator